MLYFGYGIKGRKICFVLCPVNKINICHPVTKHVLQDFDILFLTYFTKAFYYHQGLFVCLTQGLLFTPSLASDSSRHIFVPYFNAQLLKAHISSWHLFYLFLCTCIVLGESFLFYFSNLRKLRRRIANCFDRLATSFSFSSKSLLVFIEMTNDCWEFTEYNFKYKLDCTIFYIVRTEIDVLANILVIPTFLNSTSIPFQTHWLYTKVQ